MESHDGSFVFDGYTGKRERYQNLKGRERKVETQRKAESDALTQMVPIAMMVVLGVTEVAGD